FSAAVHAGWLTLSLSVCYVFINYLLVGLFFFFFFFQAEDGIRDATVTGVQTCALPISDRARGPLRAVGRTRRALGGREDEAAARSEERRVGKECRSRWSPYP